ncbi:N-acetylated-alpha-linked acidic dipeptidase 2-like isoform X1 [Penaeus chinensis]|uniref:N-acetylated-alpha-linked acidic dipeptidase 2-like isoform X1 n=1 Tax=Penaeus chinensis TaxID=139456 RepID=UPI001FB6DE59|nr:N-acetylated-alpha-linked acidic dipeptidase 2-like isoform X1 [Penaeus chinensis]
MPEICIRGSDWKMPAQRLVFMVLSGLIFVVLVVLCLLLTKGSRGAPHPARENAADFIIDEVNPENIMYYLRHLTSRPHPGGTKAEEENARWVADTWRTMGLDEVHLVPFDVLLSYPKNDTPNLVRVLNEEGEAVWTSHGWQEPLYSPEESSPEVLPNFNAYSAPGNIMGDVVYAYFGREKDFEQLEDLGVSVEGKVVLARYGEVFRANIAWAAERRGAAGVILYTDPQQYAPMGEDAVYPKTVYMPGSGVQVGTVLLTDGDPLTPFYPAVASAYRLPERNSSVPKIPVQPVSYDDAREILRHMGGPEAPAEWRGGLNVTYRLGPGMAQAGWTLNLEVHTHNARATTYDVVGVIRGSEEPDRYVILGNHRDAWVFGGVDPSSGTAALLEVTRVLTSLRNQTGWRPRRSVVVCSWGSEEYGLVGSKEWTEQFGKQLMDRTVAYINVDLSIEGNYSLRTLSAPLLYDTVFEAAAKVPNPDAAEVAAGRPTVYDTWAERLPDEGHPGRPRVGIAGSGSDYRAFMHNLGVPVLDICYTYDPKVNVEPLYHTLYETFALVGELYDAGFSFQAALTRLWAIMAVDLADTQVLKFSLKEYSSFLADAQEEFLQEYGDLISSRNISMASAYRLPERNSSVPKIPVQPVSYDDAREILRHMGGPEAPAEWRGGLNVTYRLGPGMAQAGWTLNLEVHTHNARATTYDVVGVIRGSEEPDRYVILGNHRDAWVFGGVDPSSGTAALLEVTRVLTSLRNQTGWRPRRSVVVCSWGSEEYGLVGSKEWTEQFGKQLMDRTVAYINVDLSIEGNYSLRTLSAPLLYDTVFEAAAKVPNPDAAEVAAGRPTVYDTWAERLPDEGHPGRPRVGIAGSGSDYRAFMHNLGVPVLDICYTYDPKVNVEPLYHTLYETFALVGELYDAGFSFQAALTRLWAIMAVDLADTQVLKFSLKEYSSFLADAQEEFLQEYGDLISSRNISMAYFKKVVEEFSEAIYMFIDDLSHLDTSNVLAVRRVNDQLMMVERAFIDPRGLPGRPDYNHVVMAPSISDSYSGTAFSGLSDALDGIQDLDPVQQEERWATFAQHLAAVTHYISTAAKVLSDDLW